MSFASDKLYDGYVRRNMPTIVSRVKVREILVHLPCLTAHDRETIEAKREMCGNYDAMRLLLDCLKRRENWPEQFIQALEACEHPNLAAEIREEYNAVRGVRDPAPGSPSQTVVTAHVHPTPPAARASAPETKQVAAPPPEPAAEDPPGAPQSPAVAPPQATPPPPAEAAAQPPAPRTPSPSPPPQASMSPPPQINSDAHQQPEENSELEIHEGRGDEDRRDMNTPPPPQSISLTNSDVTDGSHLTLTPKKLPVQDSNPPDAKVAPSSPQAETTSAVPAVDAVDGGLSLSDGASVCLSKPSQLLSMQPQNHAGSTLHVPDLPVSAYSGDSGRLQMSVSVSDAPSARVPCQENGGTLHRNEPEENNYESPCESIVVNEGHIAEEPSMQNLDGQSLPRPAPNANGDTGKEVEPAPLTSAAAATPKQDPKLKHSFSTKAAYVSVAAGVATCAVLVGWRFMK